MLRGILGLCFAGEQQKKYENYFDITWHGYSSFDRHRK